MWRGGTGGDADDCEEKDTPQLGLASRGVLIRAACCGEGCAGIEFGRRNHPCLAEAENAMRRLFLDSARLSLFGIALLACASISLAEDRAGVLAPAEITAIYEEQTAGANVIPKVVQEAFVAAEDRNFYAVENGTSTITQQLAKRFIPPERGMLSRKISEVSTTLAIEQALERKEILAWYLHGIYLGRGCYGVEAASLAYFGKRPDQLGLKDMALLAALPKAPAALDPARNPERALMRRNFVLSEMAKAGFVTDAAGKSAATEPLGVIEPPQRCAD